MVDVFVVGKNRKASSGQSEVVGLLNVQQAWVVPAFRPAALPQGGISSDGQNTSADSEDPFVNPTV